MDSTRKITVGVAALAATVAVTLSACDMGSDRTVSGTPTASAVDVAARTSAAADVPGIGVPDVKIPASMWANRVPASDLSSYNGIFIGNATGAALVRADRGSGLCSVGPLAQDSAGRQVILTAGHCVDDFYGGDRENNDPLALGDDEGDLTPVGGLAAAVDADDGTSTKFDIDTAQVTVPGGVDMQPEIAGSTAVAGVLSEESILRLAPGTQVCVAGSKSGIECGTLTTPRDETGNIIVRNLPTVSGDSGAPAFLVDKNRHAVLIGIFTGSPKGDDSTARIVPIESELRARALCPITTVNPPHPELMAKFDNRACAR